MALTLDGDRFLCLPSFTQFYWVLLGFTQFYWVSLGLTRLSCVLLGFTQFYWVLPSFTGFLWVILGCTGFYRVKLLLGIDSIDLKKKKRFSLVWVCALFFFLIEFSNCDVTTSELIASGTEVVGSFFFCFLLFSTFLLFVCLVFF